MNYYDIFMENAVIGTATVQECGLFTHFECVCKPKKKEVLRIVAVYDDRNIDLGICVVEGESFVTNLKIPSKRLGIGVPKFYAKSKQRDVADFAPLSMECNFLQLNKIETARFVVKDGVAGLEFNYPDLLADHHNR